MAKAAYSIRRTNTLTSPLTGRLKDVATRASSMSLLTSTLAVALMGSSSRALAQVGQISCSAALASKHSATILRSSNHTDARGLLSALKSRAGISLYFFDGVGIFSGAPTEAFVENHNTLRGEASAATLNRGQLARLQQNALERARVIMDEINGHSRDVTVSTHDMRELWTADLAYVITSAVLNGFTVHKGISAADLAQEKAIAGSLADGSHIEIRASLGAKSSDLAAGNFLLFSDRLAPTTPTNRVSREMHYSDNLVITRIFESSFDAFLEIPWASGYQAHTDLFSANALKAGVLAAVREFSKTASIGALANSSTTSTSTSSTTATSTSTSTSTSTAGPSTSSVAVESTSLIKMFEAALREPRTPAQVSRAAQSVISQIKSYRLGVTYP